MPILLKAVSKTVYNVSPSLEEAFFSLGVAILRCLVPEEASATNDFTSTWLVSV